VLNAGDADLVRSMCDEVIIVSAIRQLKSDRLHAAILSLVMAIVLFFVQLLA
jgi:exopolysaccharide biosynthesis predicted pyruvyltransferase EpsI